MNRSRQSDTSSSLGLRLGALLTAGGLLLASQGLPAAREPAAMEAAGSSGSGEDATDDRRSPTEDTLKLNGRDPESEIPVKGGGDGDRKKHSNGNVQSDGQYKFYILSEVEAAAEALGVSKAGGGAGESGSGGGGDGKLRGRYNFVIIGEGAAADAAVESILRMQPEAEILFLSDETVRCNDCYCRCSTRVRMGGSLWEELTLLVLSSCNRCRCCC